MLVALLALSPGKPVSVERIIDLLWPDEPPPTAREMVRIYVGRARKRLGESAITTQPAGYALATDSGSVDALRFQRICNAASRMLEEGDSGGAVKAVDEALALWQGPPLADLESLPFVRDEQARLEEQQLHAIEDRIEAELTLGRAGRLVAQLESLVREHPYRERLRGQLMLALYRSGRQTEALHHYQDGRNLLIEELGVEPDPDLQEMQKAILRQDPSLQVDAHRAVQAPTPSTAGAPAQRSKRVLAGAVAAALIIAIAVAVALVTFGRRHSSRRIGPHTVGAIDPRTGAIGHTLHLGGLLTGLAAEDGHLWVGDGERPSLTELDTGRLRTVRTLPLSSFPFRTVAGFGAVWVANGFDGTITHIDSKNGRARVFKPEPRASGRVQLAIGDGTVWAASQDGVLSRLDPRSQRATGTVTGIGRPNALAAGLGSVWLAEATQDTILRIGPTPGGVVRPIPIGGIGEGIAVGDGSVWVVTPSPSRLWRINPSTDAVTASIVVGGGPTTVALTPHAVWVGSQDGSISRVDPANDRVVQTIASSSSVAGLAALPDRVWVSTR